MHDVNLRKEIESKRLEGISAEELSKRYSIPRGTVYYWVRSIILPEKAKQKLRSNSDLGRQAGRRTIQQNREQDIKDIKAGAATVLKSLSFDVSNLKYFCALLFWAEGAKMQSSLRFTNSDPLMIQTFLLLLRNSFSIDESKFRVTVHIHSYHDDCEMKAYWSEVTGIPIAQFYRSYRKPHTGKTKKEGYRGCIMIYYYDAKIAKELKYLYTTLYSRLSLI